MLLQTPGLKTIETCANGKTLKSLEIDLKMRNISYSCEDNPRNILFFMCSRDPLSKECQSVKISLNKSGDFASSKMLLFITLLISIIYYSPI